MPWVRFDELCDDCAARHRKTGKPGRPRKASRAEVLKLHRAGSTPAEIAEALGCSVATVYARLGSG